MKAELDRLKVGAFSSSVYIKCEPHEKPVFTYVKTKAQISCTVTAQLISTFVFATYIVQAHCFLNLKFQAFSHLLWL